MKRRVAAGLAVLAALGLAGPVPAGAEPTTQPAADRLLRAELRMLRATVTRQQQQIEKLNAQLAQLADEIERLRGLCREAGLDPDRPPPSKTPKPTTAPVPAPKPATAYPSVAELLRAVPKRIMPPGDARAAQRTELAKWATRQLPGRTLTVEVTVLALRTFGPRGAEVVGEVPSPARLHGRLAHCMVYARFPAGDVKQLRQLKKGVRIRLSGVFPQGHPGLGAPLRPGRGEIEVELVGHRLGTKERVDGWSQRHAFIEISLWNCRLLK